MTSSVLGKLVRHQGTQGGGRRALSSCTRMLLVCGALLCGAFGNAAEAQCALQVNPSPGGTGYRERGYGCEGLYIQSQSAPINVQVTSLVKGGLSLPASGSVDISVPDSLPGLRDTVAVVGRGREANLNWALDGYATSGSAMKWNLDEVIREIKIHSSQIGLFGETRQKNGLGGPVYIPLEVAGRRGEGLDSLELVIRIPAAGAMQYRLGDQKWSKSINGNGDGYFHLMLRPIPAGRNDLEVRYRTSKGVFGAPESLSILF